MRTCTDCTQTRPLEQFLPIRGTSYVYGRCRACRNARARERYHSTPEARAAEVARAWRNKQASKLRRRLACMYDDCLLLCHVPVGRIGAVRSHKEQGQQDSRPPHAHGAALPFRR